MVSAGEQVGTKCSTPFTHITGLWLYESHSWCLGHWAPISLIMIKTYICGKDKQSGRTPWRAASLCGERKALRRGSDAVPEAGMIDKQQY